MTLRPVCGDCKVEMDIIKNGVKVWGEIHNRIRNADLYRCPECGSEVIKGFGNPIYVDDIEKRKQRIKDYMGIDWFEKYFFELDESVEGST